MKNRLTLFLALALVLFVAIGCSLGGLSGTDESGSKDSRGSSTDGEKTTEKQTEAEPSGDVVKVGIPECDEVATYINDNAEEIEGSIILRGIVYIYKNVVLVNIKDGIEKMDEKERKKMAEVCERTLKDLKKSMKE